jgi:hypothetical protein
MKEYRKFRNWGRGFLLLKLLTLSLFINYEISNHLYFVLFCISSFSNLITLITSTDVVSNKEFKGNYITKLFSLLSLVLWGLYGYLGGWYLIYFGLEFIGFIISILTIGYVLSNNNKK